MRGHRVLQYISDLHLEVTKLTPKLSVHASKLALCGDIGNPFNKHTIDFLKYTSSNFDKVFYIMGNHEYKKSLYQQYNKEDCKKQMKELCYNLGIDFLDNDVYEEDECVFVGTTLWSDAQIFPSYVGTEKFDDHLIRQQAHQKEHQKDLEWLKQTICKYQNKQMIVMSHYSPTVKHMENRYKRRGEKYISWYATDLEYLMKPPITHWICGHIHNKSRIVINDVYCGLNAMSKDKLICEPEIIYY